MTRQRVPYSVILVVLILVFPELRKLTKLLLRNYCQIV